MARGNERVPTLPRLYDPGSLSDFNLLVLPLPGKDPSSKWPTCRFRRNQEGIRASKHKGTKKLLEKLKVRNKCLAFSSPQRQSPSLTGLALDCRIKSRELSASPMLSSKKRPPGPLLEQARAQRAHTG